MKHKEKNKKKSCDNRASQRTYEFSSEALEVLGAAKSAGKNLSDFVSLCVLEHGKIALGEKFPLEDTPPLESRLEYLEAAVNYWLCCVLEEKFEKTKVAKAHRLLLKKTAPAIWYGNLKKLTAAAKKKSLTKDTEPHEWRALIRMKEQFFEEDSE